MKRSILIFFATLLVAAAVAQNNNLYWTMRIKVKMDKRLEWEKKVPVYLKTHYPQFGFRALEVMTGPNSGSYIFSMGPMSYKDFDVPPVFPKGEEALKKDGQSLDALSESFEVTHYRRVDALSRMRTDRNYKYARITFLEIADGSWSDVEAHLAKILAVREKNDIKMDINYFRPVHSGAINRFVMVRYIERMEELDETADFETLYDKMYGKNAWFKDFRRYLDMLTSNSTELCVYRPDLSTVKPLTVSVSKQ